MAVRLVLFKSLTPCWKKVTIDRCFIHPEVTAVLIDPLASNTKAIRFYERMGFEFVEARSFDEDDCLVYQMRREFWVKKREFDQSSK
jgi:RimJ/RimL family protein N-acetyltransferase